MTRGGLDILRRADWLNVDRLRAYGRLFAFAMLLVLAAAYGKILAPALHDPASRPLGSDFDPFWSGAKLALSGHPQAAYDPKTIQAAEQHAAAVPADDILLYQYPPTWMLLCLPLGLLPYLAALPAFLGAGYLVLVLGVRRVLAHPLARAPILAFPGAVINAIIGQNGFFTAACFCGALLWLERRPALAGACLGLFAAKPHLAICVPFALGAARRWTAFWSCAVTSVSLCLLSWAVLGTATWHAFLNTLWVSRAVLQSPQTGPKVITVYEAVRLLQGGIGLAAAIQAGACLACIAAILRLAVRRPGGGAEMAAIAAAATLCTPYAMDYDLVCLAIPMAWIASEAGRGGWRPWEKILLLACYTLPFYVRVLNLRTGLSLAPPLTACLLWVVVSRAQAMRRT